MSTKVEQYYGGARGTPSVSISRTSNRAFLLNFHNPGPLKYTFRFHRLDFSGFITSFLAAAIEAGVEVEVPEELRLEIGREYYAKRKAIERGATLEKIRALDEAFTAKFTDPKPTPIGPPPFKVGDRVRVVDDTQSSAMLNHGDIHTIRSVEGNSVSLEGRSFVWRPSRFEPAPESEEQKLVRLFNERRREKDTCSFCADATSCSDCLWTKVLVFHGLSYRKGLGTCSGDANEYIKRYNLTPQQMLVGYLWHRREKEYITHKRCIRLIGEIK